MGDETEGHDAPPAFGNVLSKDEFKRRHRCVSEGPNSAGKNDPWPWREARWLVRGRDANRRATTMASWLILVDEATWAWAG